jgi:uncharacterized NAD-dependent epimerase/dehydratase family protein
MRQYLTAARLTNHEARFVGISLNTSGFDTGKRRTTMAALEEEFGLPVLDPMVDGAAAIAQALVAQFPAGDSR